MSESAADLTATPRTDREVYRASHNDIGFEVVNPSLCRILERELMAEREKVAQAEARAQEAAQLLQTAWQLSVERKERAEAAEAALAAQGAARRNAHSGAPKP